MRRRKSLIAGIVRGLICVAAILLYAQELNDAMEAERAQALSRYGGEQVEAYVATRDIAPGEAVSEANCEKRLWVGELLPQDAVLDLAEVQGKAIASPIYAGEAISLRRFSGGDSPALQVPEGLCAVSVPSKSVSAVGGSIAAGSTVDVYVTSGTATECIATSVLVLSTSATASEGDQSVSEISWVTLAVAPDLVEELIAAAQKADLYFTLPSAGAEGSVASLDGEDSPNGGEGGDVATDESSNASEPEVPSNAVGSGADEAEESENSSWDPMAGSDDGAAQKDAGDSEGQDTEADKEESDG